MLERQEEIDHVREAVQRLEARERYVVASCMHGKTQLEVAELLGVTRSRVNQIYLRAVRRLKSELKVDE